MTLTCLAQLSQWAPCYSYIGTLGLFVCTWFPFSSLCGKRKGWVFFKKRIKLFTFFNSLRRSIPYRLDNFAKFSISAETLQIFANRTLRRCEDKILRNLRGDSAKMTSLTLIISIGRNRETQMHKEILFLA